MDPEFAAAYAERQSAAANAAPAPPSGKSLVETAREGARSSVQPSVRYFTERLPPESAYTVEDRFIPVDNGEIRVRCVVPREDESQTFPVLVWYHGGAWVVGDLDQDDAFLRGLSVDVQIAAISVEYRLGPEHPFPTGLNDSYAALKWTVENAASLRVAPQKGLIVGGDSAGANLATVCAIMARDDPFFGDRPVTGQLLREPSVIYPDAYPEKYKSEFTSMEEFRDGPLLTRDMMLQCRALVNAPRDDPRFSPLLFPSHAGVAPAFITYNGVDVLRDDGRVWARVLSEAGVNIKVERYPGVSHGFYYWFPTISLAKKAFQDTKDGLRWLMAQTRAQAAGTRMESCAC